VAGLAATCRIQSGSNGIPPRYLHEGPRGCGMEPGHRVYLGRFRTSRDTAIGRLVGRGSAACLSRVIPLRSAGARSGWAEGRAGSLQFDRKHVMCATVREVRPAEDGSHPPQEGSSNSSANADRHAEPDRPGPRRHVRNAPLFAFSRGTAPTTSYARGRARPPGRPDRPARADSAMSESTEPCSTTIARRRLRTVSGGAEYSIPPWRKAAIYGANSCSGPPWPD